MTALPSPHLCCVLWARPFSSLSLTLLMWKRVLRGPMAQGCQDDGDSAAQCPALWAGLLRAVLVLMYDLPPSAPVFPFAWSFQSRGHRGLAERPQAHSES